MEHFVILTDRFDKAREFAADRGWLIEPRRSKDGPRVHVAVDEPMRLKGLRGVVLINLGAGAELMREANAMVALGRAQWWL